MKSKVTREIELSANLTETLQKLRAELEQMQAQFKAKSEHFGTLLSGVCLQEGLDAAAEGIDLSAECDKLLVYDLPKEEEKVPTEPKTSKKKK